MTQFPHLDGCELSDDEAPFLLQATPLAPTRARLAAWAWRCCNGSLNVLRHRGMLYSWDAHPPKLKNGALQGRCYAQAPGELPKDIGGYKIAADGRVLRLPNELRDLLPGGSEAQDDHTEAP